MVELDIDFEQFSEKSKQVKEEIQRIKGDSQYKVLIEICYKIYPILEVLDLRKSLIVHSMLARTLLEITLLVAYVSFSDEKETAEAIQAINSYCQLESLKFHMMNYSKAEEYRDEPKATPIDPNECLNNLIYEYDKFFNLIKFDEEANKKQKIMQPKEFFHRLYEKCISNQPLTNPEIQALIKLKSIEPPHALVMWSKISESVFVFMQFSNLGKLPSGYGDKSTGFIRFVFQKLHSSVHSLSCLAKDYTFYLERDDGTPVARIDMSKDRKIIFHDVNWMLAILHTALKHLNESKIHSVHP